PGFTLITQNVDGLHQRAGSRDVIELHGSIWHAKCLARCGFRGEVAKARVVDGIPRCECGAHLRPGVVMFGDPLEAATFEAATAATRCDVFLVVGTSGIVWPAAGLPLEARAQGATVIEINPETTPLTSHA